MWQILRYNLALLKNYIPPRMSENLVLFIAAKATRPINPDAWSSIVGGNIETHEIDCQHGQMSHPVALAKIGKILANQLRR